MIIWDVDNLNVKKSGERSWSGKHGAYRRKKKQIDKGTISAGLRGVTKGGKTQRPKEVRKK